MKRLSVTSEVVLLLREMRVGQTFTSAEVAEKLNVGVSHVSAACNTFEQHGFIEVDRSGGTPYKRKILRSFKHYDLRNAPAAYTKPGRIAWTKAEKEPAREQETKLEHRAARPQVLTTLEALTTCALDFTVELEALTQKLKKMNQLLEVKLCDLNSVISTADAPADEPRSADGGSGQ